jgi:hypothetical protein
MHETRPLIVWRIVPGSPAPTLLISLRIHYQSGGDTHVAHMPVAERRENGPHLVMEKQMTFPFANKMPFACIWGIDIVE